MPDGPRKLKPHELAPHIAALFPLILDTDLRPVRDAMEHAIDVLRTHQHVVDDLSDLDFGIPFALRIERGDASEKTKAAAVLLRMCLHARERGSITDNDRRYIPLLLCGLAGYVPDSNARAARHKRPSRAENDALDRGLDEAVRIQPDATWKEHAHLLEEKGVVVNWNHDKFIFTDGEKECSISRKSFQNRLTAAVNRRAGNLSRVAG